jgi:DNA-binding MarR family transcriptional regulator
MVNPQVGYLLKQAQSLLHLRMEEALRPLHLTVSQYSCLHSLRREPGISAAALARATFVTRQSMNAMLQQLIDRGLVARPSRAESGRALPTLLTEAGADALDAAQELVDAVERRMLGGLSSREASGLAGGLAACIEALESPSGRA